MDTGKREAEFNAASVIAAETLFHVHAYELLVHTVFLIYPIFFRVTEF